MNKALSKNFSPRRILVIQLRQIGDVLLATPSLRALRRRFPAARVCLLVEPIPAQVIRGNPNVDEIILRDPKSGWAEPFSTIWKIRARRFDLVIDFLANPRSALLSFLSGAPVTIGRADRRRRRFYTHPVQPRGVFAADQKLSLLRILDCGEESPELDVVVSPQARARVEEWRLSAGLARARRPVVCLEPFQKWPALTYPAEHFIRLCERMVEEWGATVIVCWGPGREEEAKAIVAGSRAPLVLAPPTDLMELAALYETADLWVGVDGGPRHLAAAVGRPTFAVLGPSDHAWTPPGPRHLSVSRDLPCRPCNRRVCPEGHRACLVDFPPDEVFDRLHRFYRRLEEK